MQPERGLKGWSCALRALGFSDPFIQAYAADSTIMKIHEYQARALLTEAGVPVPPSEVVQTVDEAVAAYETISGNVMVKAQVFAGGRGKAGFVKFCTSADQVREAAAFMLSNRMVSKQTGPEGIEVKKLLVASAVDIESEYYVGCCGRPSQARVPWSWSPARAASRSRRWPRRIPTPSSSTGSTRTSGSSNFQSPTGQVAGPHRQGAGQGACEGAPRAWSTSSSSTIAALAEINPLVRTPDGRGSSPSTPR